MQDRHQQDQKTKHSKLFPDVASVHNKFLNKAAGNVHGALPKVVFNKNLFLMNLAAEINKSEPESLDLGKCISNAMMDLIISYGYRIAMGPMSLPFGITSFVGDHINTDYYQEVISKRLKQIDSSELPEDLKDELRANQRELMESCILPYCFKKVSELDDWLRSTVKSFAYTSIPSLHGEKKPSDTKCADTQAEPEMTTSVAMALDFAELYEQIAGALASLPKMLPEFLGGNDTVKAVEKQLDIVELFKKQITYANDYLSTQIKSYIERQFKEIETNANEMLVKSEKLEEIVTNKNLKDLPPSKQFKLLSPQLLRLGMMITDAIYCMKKNRNIFEEEKSRLISDIENALSESGLCITDDRKKQYLDANIIKNINIPSIRSHVLHLMSEDLVLSIKQRKETFLSIKKEIINIKSQIAHFMTIERVAEKRLNLIVKHQIAIKEKIESIKFRKLPESINLGINILSNLTATVEPAAGMLLSGMSYLFNLSVQHQQKKLSKKVNTYVGLFQQEEIISEHLKSKVNELDAYLEEKRIKLSFLHKDLVQNADGREVLAALRSTINEITNQADEEKSNLESLKTSRDSLIEKKNKLSKMLERAKGKKQKKLQIELDKVLTDLTANKIARENCKIEISNYQDVENGLENLYKQHLPLAPIFEWFDKYTQHYFQENNEETLKGLLLFRKTVKDQLHNIDLLYSDQDDALKGLAEEIMILVAPLKAMGMNKVAKILGSMTLTTQFGYNLFRTIQKYIDTVSLINASRFITNENGLLLAQRSFFENLKTMGASFTIKNIITPVISAINLGCHIISSLFGLDWFVNPTETQLKQLSYQLRNNIDEVLDKLHKISEQSRVDIMDVKTLLYDIHSAQLSNAQQQMLTQLFLEREKRRCEAVENCRDLRKLEEIYHKLNSKLNKLAYLNYDSSNSDTFIRLLSAAMAACDREFNAIHQNGVIIYPLTAVHYIYENLPKSSVTMPENMRLANFNMLIQILTNIVKMLYQRNSQLEVSEVDRKRINEILIMARELENFLNVLSRQEWIKDLHESIIKDIKSLSNVLSKWNIESPIRDSYFFMDNNLESSINQSFNVARSERINQALKQLSNTYQEFDLYYVNFNKKSPPKKHSPNGVFIRDVSNSSPPRLNVRYMLDHEFTYEWIDGIQTTNFNIIITEQQRQALVKLSKGSLNPIAKYKNLNVN